MKWILGEDSFKTHESSESHCFLLTNGLGGFSSLSASGSLCRNDQALLMAAVTSPNERWNLVANVHENIMAEGTMTDLASQRYVNLTKNQSGFRYLHGFQKDIFPKWQYQVDGLLIDKEICMLRGENTVIVTYTVDADTEFDLTVTPLYSFAPKGQIPDRHQMISLADHEVCSEDKKVCFQTNGSSAAIENECIQDLYYARDAVDGRDCVGTVFKCHKIHFSGEAGLHHFYIIFSDKERHESSVDDVFLLINKERDLAHRFLEESRLKDPLARTLVLAARDFISYRDSTGCDTILAGFPFFGDWGRDTMIAMLGCVISTKQFVTAKKILQTFMFYVHHGLMPNLFPEGETEPLYNTVDAALLFFEALWQYVNASGDQNFLNEAWPVMEEIIRSYSVGTDYGIYMDRDGLICAGSGLWQLTWMDVRVGDILPTPRHGKPVEINAYWYNALMIMAETARLRSDAEAHERYRQMADQTKAAFLEQFWNEERGCLKDVLSGGDDENQIRCNQVWTMSLSYPLVTGEMARSVLRVIRKHLYTPWGLRTLSPYDPAFCGHYGGAQFERDLAYHQGTVWPFPLGAYYLASLRWAEDQDAAARQIKKSLSWLEPALREGCVGQIAEIYDGEHPDKSQGCFAQAWSVGELLRVYAALEEYE